MLTVLAHSAPRTCYGMYTGSTSSAHHF
jgi:hypothetical protein